VVLDVDVVLEVPLNAGIIEAAKRNWQQNKALHREPRAYMKIHHLAKFNLFRIEHIKIELL
jgi:hypothetical protein